MTYTEFFEIQDACSAELDEFQKNYEDALAREKAADDDRKNWAKVETAQAKLIYLTAHAVYIDFLKNSAKKIAA